MKRSRRERTSLDSQGNAGQLPSSLAPHGAQPGPVAPMSRDVGTWTRRWRIYRLRLLFDLTLLLLAWLAPWNLASAAQGHLILVAAFVVLGLIGINPALFWYVRVRLPDASRTRMTRHVIVGCGLLLLCALSWPGPRSLDLLNRGVLMLAEMWLWTFESNLRHRLDPPACRERR